MLAVTCCFIEQFLFGLSLSLLFHCWFVTLIKNANGGYANRFQEYMTGTSLLGHIHMAQLFFSVSLSPEMDPASVPNLT